MEYRGVFLSTYVAFTTADELLTRLLDLFHDTEAGPAQQRTEMRIKYVLVYLTWSSSTWTIFSIVVFMKQWVTCAYIRMESQIKDKIFEFTIALVRSNDTSVRMKDLAKELMLASGQPVRSPPTTLLSFISLTIGYVRPRSPPYLLYFFKLHRSVQPTEEKLQWA